MSLAGPMPSNRGHVLDHLVSSIQGVPFFGRRIAAITLGSQMWKILKRFEMCMMACLQRLSPAFRRLKRPVAICGKKVNSAGQVTLPYA
jgi:hypothetical protein